MQQIVLFASGTGSNVKAIIDYFRNTQDVGIALIVSNREDAGVLATAAKEGIPSVVTGREEFKGEALLARLQGLDPALLVLAGFLWKIPHAWVRAFPGRIINIHPALLPAFGGKGMYGIHVHRAVIEADAQESGITIHYVNEVYDSGAIILSARCPVLPGDQADVLAARVLRLEHYYYPRVIRFLLREQLQNLPGKEQ